MHFKLNFIVLVALILRASSINAQDVLSQAECKTPNHPQHYPTKSGVPPEVNVVCGANSVTQTLPTQAAQNDTTKSSTKSRDDFPQGSSLMVALITGAAGVLGAFAGAMSSYLVALAKAKYDLELETKRLSANVIATERLRWLQDIRERLSTLFQQMDLQYNLLKRTVDSSRDQTTQKQFDELSLEVMRQCNMITLMLNPEKPDQAALRNSLQKSLAFMNNAFQDPKTAVTIVYNDQYIINKQAAFDAMTRLGVETWKQVKSLS